MKDELENLETPGIEKILNTIRKRGGDLEWEKEVRDQLKQWEEKKNRKAIDQKKSN